MLGAATLVRATETSLGNGAPTVSSKERGGRMVTGRLASVVFPEPGGPTRSMFATVCDLRVEIADRSGFATAK